MGRTKILTDDMIHRIASDAVRGATLRALCQSYGISATTARKALNEKGVKAAPNPTIRAFEYEDIVAACDRGQDFGELAKRWGLRRIDIRAIAVGECPDMPEKFWGRADLAVDRNDICIMASGNRGAKVQTSEEVITAIRSGEILGEVTGRVLASRTSPLDCGYVESYRRFTSKKKLTATRMIRRSELGGMWPNQLEVEFIAKEMGVPYYAIWELCVSVGNDRWFTPPPDPKFMPSSFDDLRSSEIYMLERYADEIRKRPNYSRSLRDMFEDGSFGWVHWNFPQPEEPDRRIITGIGRRMYEADTEGDVYRRGSRNPLQPKLVDGEVYVKMMKEWRRLDFLVCCAFHGRPVLYQTVHHFTDQRDCRPSKIAWTQSIMGKPDDRRRR